MPTVALTDSSALGKTKVVADYHSGLKSGHGSLNAQQVNALKALWRQ